MCIRDRYEKHPVRTDIAGTVESIAEITPDYLYDCYHTFYNLNNMVLCIAGNVDKDQVIDLADRMLKPSAPVSVSRIFEEEPRRVLKHRVEQSLSVAVPIFELGFKEPTQQERVSEAGIAATDILLELMASEASPMFRKLLDQGLVNEASFGTEYFEGPGYAAIIFSGESNDPDAVAETIFNEADRLRSEGIDEDAFQRAKKSVYGRNIAALNSAENIANSIVSFTFAGRELFRYIDAIAEVSLSDVEMRLQQCLQKEYATLSVVKPLAGDVGGKNK